MEQKKNRFDTVSIPFTGGINRQTTHEGLEDLVNMKFEDGKLKPVQKGTSYGNRSESDLNITIHKRSAFTNHIMWNSDANTILHKSQSGGETIQTLITLELGETVNDIKPYLNYLLVSTSTRLLTFLYDQDNYVSISIKHNIDITLILETSHTVTSDWQKSTANDGFTQESYDAIYGKFLSKLESEADDGYICGSLSWRAAFKLADGTYVMHTAPELISTSVDSIYAMNQAANVSLPNWEIYTQFKTNLYKVVLNPETFDDLENEKNIITSIDIFFSKPVIKEDIEQIYNVDERTIYFEPFTFGVESVLLSSLDTFDDDFEKLNSPDDGWFLVGSIPFDEVIDDRKGIFTYDEDYLDFDLWYKNYATKESLKLDQLTHHALSADKLFVYNSRLWMNDINRVFASPYNEQKYTGSFRESSEIYVTYDAKFVVTINDDNATKTVIQETTVSVIQQSTYVFRLASCPILSYPDDRASEISLYVKYSGVWKEFFTKKLSSSDTYNISTYFDTENEITSWYGIALTQFTANLYNATTVAESFFVVSNEESGTESQVQLSEIENPLVFPTAQNYPVGSGTVLDFGVMANQVSEGQFGSFPVYIFTSEGIYVAAIGTSDVVITSVKDIASDVLVGRPVSTKHGVFFTTSVAIMAITGQKPINLSKILEGRISPIVSNDSTSYFNAYSNSDVYFNNSSFNDVADTLTTLTRFRDILEDLVLGFDHLNKRLLASKEGLGYSYIFDVDTKQWYRITQEFHYFTQNYPNLLGVTSSIVYDMSDIDNTLSDIKAHFHTNALNFGTNGRTKLYQSLLRCLIKVKLSTDKAAFIMFASNDGVTWDRITGNDNLTDYINDIQVTFAYASYKFVVFAFWATLDSRFDNEIESIDAQIQHRYTYKLRT